MKSLVIAALLGATSAGRIPVKKVNLTKDMYMNHQNVINAKFLGGEHVNIKDYMNA
jgi:beta-lactamase class A